MPQHPNERKKRVKINVLFENESLVMVNKPPGLLTLPDRFNESLPSLKQMMEDRYDDLYTVHRLDKGTSGIICFAKTAASHRSLSQQFEKRQVKKVYHAFTKGTPYEEHGQIEDKIAYNMDGTVRIDNHKGKEAHSVYQVIQSFAQFAYCGIQIHTGRTHQIRIHMAHIGYPLAYDPHYGSDQPVYLSQIKRKRFNLKKGESERPIIDRVPLHAFSLVIQDPTSNKPIQVECPLPKDMSAFLNQLNKWNKI